MDKTIGKTVQKVMGAGEKVAPVKSIKLKVKFAKAKRSSIKPVTEDDKKMSKKHLEGSIKYNESHIKDHKKQIEDDRKLLGKRKRGVTATMKEFKSGTLKSGSGHKVTNPKQAIAIGLNSRKMKRKINMKFGMKNPQTPQFPDMNDQGQFMRKKRKVLTPGGGNMGWNSIASASRKVKRQMGNVKSSFKL